MVAVFRKVIGGVAVHMTGGFLSLREEVLVIFIVGKLVDIFVLMVVLDFSVEFIRIVFPANFVVFRF